MSREPGETGITVTGERAGLVMNMIGAMAAFCSGPGLDGFLAWADQRAAAAGIGQTAQRERVRELIGTLAAAIEVDQ